MSYLGGSARLRAEELIDQRVALKMLRVIPCPEEMEPKRPALNGKPRRAPFKIIAAEIRSTAGRAASISTLSRLENGDYVRPLYGLRETAIRKVFGKRVPQQAQLAELKLRKLQFRGMEMTYPLLEARETLTVLREQVESMSVRRDYSDEEYKIARAAVDSLAQRIALYRLGSAERYKDRRSAATAGLHYGALVIDELQDELLRSRKGASPAGLVIGSRAIVNNFFASYVMDVLAGQVNQLPRSRAFAEQHGKTSVFNAAFRCAELSNDPRLAHYFAEIAVLGRSRGPSWAVAAADLSVRHATNDPLVTSARLYAHF
jgi:hypothetical protein